MSDGVVGADPAVALDGVVDGTNAQRVIDAFTRCPPTLPEFNALRALLENPGATDRELSQACGLINSGWRAHVLVACHRRQADLWPDGLPPNVPLGFALTCLARYEPSTLRFWIRDELAAFFGEIVGPQSTPNQPDLPDAMLN